MIIFLEKINLFHLLCNDEIPSHSELWYLGICMIKLQDHRISLVHDTIQMHREPATARYMFLSSCINVLYPLAAKDRPKSFTQKLPETCKCLLGIPPAANWISNANRNNLSEYRSRQQQSFMGAPKSQCRFTRDHLHVQALGNFSIGHSEAIENSSLVITFSFFLILIFL